MNNFMLWDEYKKNPTPQLKQQIILAYTNLVHYVIHHSKFISLNVVDERDYFQFGIEGLSEAIDRFDPNYGTKFETYAIQRIRGKILDELRKIQIKPRPLGPGEPEVQYSNVSLNSSNDSEDGYNLQEILPNNEDTPEDIYDKNEAKELLVRAIKNLDERERLVLTLYYYENLNYKEIAEVLGITISRVSQIHTKIVNDLKKKLKNKYDR